MQRKLISIILIQMIMASGFFVLSTPSSYAARSTQTELIRAFTVQGELPNQFDKHYLGLETIHRDNEIVLTMAYDPQNDPSYQGFINFAVLTEDGLRRLLAGATLDSVNVAIGSPVQFAPSDNLMRASFFASGRGNYTVIVFNNLNLAASYTMKVEGGLLLDGASQVQAIEVPFSTAESDADILENSEPIGPEPPSTADSTTADSNAESANAPYAEVRALRVSSGITGPFEKHYLTLESQIRDGLVNLDMIYDPQNSEELIGNINFYVLTEDGLRRTVHGDRPEDVDIATGFPSPYNPNQNQLYASFQSSGHGPYTTVIFNNSSMEATYALSTEGGILIDQYGQTNESRAAAVELAAIQEAAPTIVETQETPDASSSDTLAALPAFSNVSPGEGMVGEFGTAYQHDYYGLTPSISDGQIIVTMDYAPRNIKALEGHINFWILDEDGLRRVLAGSRPEDVDIAVGGIVRFGPDQGKLRAVFNSSAKGPYTVIVFNNSNVPARYLLTASGGTLINEAGPAVALQSLP